MILNPIAGYYIICTFCTSILKKKVRIMAREVYDTKCVADKLDKITEWYREGKDDSDVAKLLGVSRRTIFNWISYGSAPDIEAPFEGREFDNAKYEKYRPFVEARRLGQDTAVAKLENTAFLLATGKYVHEETYAGVIDGVFTTKKYNKTLPPDKTLLWRLLLNKAPEKYRDKVELSHSGSLDSSVRVLKDFTDEQLSALKQLALNQRQLNNLDEDEEVSIDEGGFDA